jgi:hypothetical protein
MEGRAMYTLHQTGATRGPLDTEVESGTDEYRLENLGSAADCETIVVDAMRHLLSGFLILDNLRTGPQPLDESVSRMFGFVSLDIASVLSSLNDCSVGFWAKAKADSFQLRRQSNTNGQRSDRAHGHHRAPRGETNPFTRSVAQDAHDSALLRESQARTQRGSVEAKRPSLQLVSSDPTPNPEWVRQAASATLDLVRVNAALEALSYSAYPWGAPESFESACFRLCLALVTLDDCLATAGD